VLEYRAKINSWRTASEGGPYKRKNKHYQDAMVVRTCLRQTGKGRTPSRIRAKQCRALRREEKAD